MDQGIIKTLKTLYRGKLLRKKLQLYESGSDVSRNITIRDALIMMNESWADMKVPTIINCFVKAGFNVARIRSEQMDEEEERERQRQAEHWVAQADALLELQVGRLNDICHTNPDTRMRPEEFVNVLGEDVVHAPVQEDAPVREEGPS